MNRPGVMLINGLLEEIDGLFFLSEPYVDERLVVWRNILPSRPLLDIPQHLARLIEVLLATEDEPHVTDMSSPRQTAGAEKLFLCLLVTTETRQSLAEVHVHRRDKGA